MGTNSSRATRLVAVLLAGAVVLSACTGDDDTASPTSSGSLPSSTGPATTAPSTPGTADPDPSQPGTARPAGLKLSPGKAKAKVADPTETVDGTPLDQDAVDGVIDRLPEWDAADPDLLEPFKWPTESIKAPQGKPVDVPFPQTPKPPVEPDDAGPLKVLRHQPEGDVTLAPFIGITFNQPMVPVATVGQLAAADVPVTITPAISGSWQWLGTETLRFTADAADYDRLPMATEFTVTVPAGTESASGNALAKAVSFSFNTPPVTVTDLSPVSTSMRLSGVFVATFDQQIDQQAVLDKMTLTAGGAAQTVRLATQAEIDADDTAPALLDGVKDGRWVAFVTSEPLPSDAAVSITFAAGTPSAEGPRVTAKDKVFSGRTYAPLKLKSAGCSGNCYPGGGFNLDFNNALDAEAFDPTTLTITPEIPGISIAVSGNQIYVQGNTQGAAEYTVTVPAGLLDTYDQELAEAQIRKVKIHSDGPSLQPFTNMVTTLDPFSESPTLTVQTMNRTEFRLRVFAVSPAEWSAYTTLYGKVSEPYRNTEITIPDGWQAAIDREVSISGEQNVRLDTRLDLSEAFAGQTTDYHGHLVVLVEPTDADHVTGDDLFWQNRPTVTWAQATTIGLDAVSDNKTLRAWATDLRTGSALADVQLTWAGQQPAVATGAEGLATLDLAGYKTLLATQGDQTALLPSGNWGELWKAQNIKDELRWLVNDDRGTYRPGETVSVKGWVRRLELSDDAQLGGIDTGASVGWVMRDGYGNEIAKGTADLGALGGFDLTAKIPDGANLGTASIEFATKGVAGIEQYAGQYYHQFELADFRRPDFEVITRTESDGPYLADTPLTLAADATYYAGGPLGDAGVEWQVRTAEANYAPPGWDKYTFGIWKPFWLDYQYGYGYRGGYDAGPAFYGEGYYDCCGYPDNSNAKVETIDGVTDSDGSNYVEVQVGDLGEDFDGLPVTVTAQASVTDVNRQTLAGTSDVLVHPSNFYVGLDSSSTFVKQGQELTIDAIVTDIDGAAAAGRTVNMRAALLTTTWTNGESVETESDPQTCTVTSTEAAVSCTFAPTAGGEYRITATVSDDTGRTSRSQLSRWVSGPDATASRSVDNEALTLVPDKAEYSAGDTAQLMVQSPVATGTGLLTVTRGGIKSTSTFPVTEGSAVIEIPLVNADIPGVSVNVEVVGASARTNADGTPATDGALRPAFATGRMQLPISTESRKLTVLAEPADPTLTPGTDTSVDVTVTDADGNPVAGSEFEVVVVDEAVLALGAYELPDPMKIFYGQLPSWLNTVFGRSTVQLADRTSKADGDQAANGSMAAATQESGMAMPAGMPVSETSLQYTAGDMDTAARLESPALGQVAVRKNFDALAVFEPSVVTDANGKATIAVPLPGSLTRYRVMVVAVAGADRFGTAEANITAQLPLTVRPTAPRFLNFGDTFELPVLVQNLSDTAMTVDVVLQTSNLTVTGEAGRQVSVPANSRIEVAFPVAAAQVGTARFRVAAVSGENADATTVELPVYTPATSESFATYGEVDSGGAVQQPVSAPTGVLPEFGGLEISTSSTALQRLTDAVIYLNDYEYDSADGYASQIMSIATLGKVLQAFDAAGLPSAAQLAAEVDSNIDNLVALQNDDGGFPYWQKGKASEAYISIQAVHALLVAKAEGFTVPAQALEMGGYFLQEIKSHFPPKASQETKDILTAYALHVRGVSGENMAQGAQNLWQERGTKLPLEAIAWIWPLLNDAAASAEISTLLDNIAVDTAGAVTFTSTVTDDDWVTLRSDRRTDGLLLDALISVQPDSDLIPKVVKGLMAGQQQGRWNNVQENTFILLALKHYFDTFEAATPDLVARVWLGEQFAGEHEFQGRTTEQAQMNIPTEQLVTAGDSDVVISNDGVGRLYYRIGLKTAPSSFELDPLDRGFVVQRTYQGVDDPADVTQDADGTWRIKAGAKVKVTLNMVARSQRTHVALIDPLPAGLEILNPSLATTPKDLDPQPEERMTDYWYWTWYDNQNLRDDRAEAFSQYLKAGVYEYSYVAQATTIGSFVVPPPRAEEIYSPETFGRGAGDTVIVSQ